jgi:serine/threonine protein kinase
VGTLLYTVPEVVRGDKYDEKCDMYSFAVVLLGLLQLRRHVFKLFTAAAKSVEAAAGVAPSNGSNSATATAAAAAADGAAAAAAAAAATGTTAGAAATTGTGRKGPPRYTPHMVTVAIVTTSLRPALPPVCSMILTILNALSQL